MRFLGLSEASPTTSPAGLAVHPITALQTGYSLFTRDVEDVILPTIRADVVPSPGTKRVAYLEENAAAVDVVLTPLDLEQPEQALPRSAVQGRTLRRHVNDRRLSSPPKATSSRCSAHHVTGPHWWFVMNAVMSRATRSGCSQRTRWPVPS